MKGACGHEEDMIRRHRSVFRLHSRPFYDRQQIPLHTFPRDIGAVPPIRTDGIGRGNIYATWNERYATDGGKLIPPCMGYKLSPGENPFEPKAADAL